MIFKSYQQNISSLLAVALLIISFNAFAQSDPLSLDDVPTEKVFVKEAFNAPQIIYTQSTNMVERKRLDFVLGHRFGKFNEGAFNAFGFDQAFVRIAFEYGITDWLTVGVGRSSVGKTFDSYLKSRILVQGGPKNIPVSAVIVMNASLSAYELNRQKDLSGDAQLANHLVYTIQSSISRQFSSRFSIQLTGSMVHRNLVIDDTYSNDVFGMGGGARIKLNKRIHFVGEYTYTFNNPDNIKNPYAIGVEIVAGGHVFTLYSANGAGILEKSGITETEDSELRFGFSVRRSFRLGKPEVEGGKVKY